MLAPQLDWLEQQLSSIGDGATAVLLLHCYPSDLKQGGERLRALVASPSVRLVDMGHTHYNELANAGRTFYTATRSTGLPVAMSTSPADERFLTEVSAASLTAMHRVRVRAKVWSRGKVQGVTATLNGHSLLLRNMPGSIVWEGEFAEETVREGVHTLRVEVIHPSGQRAQDEIRVVYGPSTYHAPQRQQRDQDNAVAPWPERGLLGTQLGPNKNGRNW